ncbi:MAG: divalent cation tolerance protein CutA, partial [Halobacteria archaeon]|nr:divalent cation tolerance protein CutA [Halobacteria archaeon]
MITVYTTVPNQEEATRIAHTLVEERFAACVNTHEVGSVYRWEGEIIEEGEVALDV